MSIRYGNGSIIASISNSNSSNTNIQSSANPMPATSMNSFNPTPHLFLAQAAAAAAAAAARTGKGEANSNPVPPHLINNLIEPNKPGNGLKLVTSSSYSGSTSPPHQTSPKAIHSGSQASSVSARSPSTSPPPSMWGSIPPSISSPPTNPTSRQPFTPAPLMINTSGNTNGSQTSVSNPNSPKTIHSNHGQINGTAGHQSVTSNTPKHNSHTAGSPSSPSPAPSSSSSFFSSPSSPTSSSSSSPSLSSTSFDVDPHLLSVVQDIGGNAVYAIFAEHCSAGAGVSVQIYLEIFKYQQLKLPIEQYAQAKSIYTTFLQESAPTPLTLPPTLSSILNLSSFIPTLLSALSTRASLTTDYFNLIQSVALRHISTFFPAFLASPAQQQFYAVECILLNPLKYQQLLKTAKQLYKEEYVLFYEDYEKWRKECMFTIPKQGMKVVRKQRTYSFYEIPLEGISTNNSSSNTNSGAVSPSKSAIPTSSSSFTSNSVRVISKSASVSSLFPSSSSAPSSPSASPNTSLIDSPTPAHRNSQSGGGTLITPAVLWLEQQMTVLQSIYNKYFKFHAEYEILIDDSIKLALIESMDRCLTKQHFESYLCDLMLICKEICVDIIRREIISYYLKDVQKPMTKNVLSEIQTRSRAKSEFYLTPNAEKAVMEQKKMSLKKMNEKEKQTTSTGSMEVGMGNYEKTGVAAKVKSSSSQSSSTSSSISTSPSSSSSPSPGGKKPQKSKSYSVFAANKNATGKKTVAVGPRSKTKKK